MRPLVILPNSAERVSDSLGRGDWDRLRHMEVVAMPLLLLLGAKIIYGGGLNC